MQWRREAERKVMILGSLLSLFTFPEILIPSLEESGERGGLVVVGGMV
jgi:hypothetical protein